MCSELEKINKTKPEASNDFPQVPSNKNQRLCCPIKIKNFDAHYYVYRGDYFKQKFSLKVIIEIDTTVRMTQNSECNNKMYKYIIYIFYIVYFIHFIIINNIQYLCQTGILISIINSVLD